MGIRCLVAQQPYVILNVLCSTFLAKAILAGFCEVLNIFVTTSNGGQLLLYKTLNIEELAILHMPSILEGLNVLVVLSVGNGPGGLAWLTQHLARAQSQYHWRYGFH